MNKLHNKDIDKLKGLGIILTVIGHSGSPFSPIIYLFHMPLFYFLSGYTFKENNIYDIKGLIKRRYKSIYIPFLKYSLIFILFHNIFVKLNFYTLNLYYDKSTFLINLFKNFMFITTEQLLGAFWFLTSIFITNILYAILKKHCENKQSKYINSSVFFLFLLNITVFSKNIEFNIPLLSYYFLMIRISCSGILFFHLGNLCNKYKILYKINVNFIYLVIAILFLFINTNYGSVSMGSNEYGSSPTFFIINSLIGIYVAYCIAKYITNKFITDIFIFLGKNTIDILALHMISFKLINYFQIKFYNYPIEYLSAFPYIDGSNGWWILYSLSGIILPVMMISLKSIILIKTKSFISNSFSNNQNTNI